MARIRPHSLRLFGAPRHNPILAGESAFLGWEFEGDDPQWRQSEIRIQAATTSQLLESNQPDLWDSGWISEAKTQAVRYEGQLPPPTEDCYWRIRARSVDGTESDWSEVASWTMGPNGNSHWGANWISTPSSRICGCFTKTFEWDGAALRRARVYYSARGLVRLWINGERIDDHELFPGWTDYRFRIPYDIAEVSHLLQPGANEITMEVAPGWYAGNVCWFGPSQYGGNPAGLFRLALEFEDRKPELVVSDESWMFHMGTVLFTDLLDGYDDAPTSIKVEPMDANALPIGQALLVPRSEEPVRITESIPAQSVTNKGEGNWLVDFGQNIAGIVRITGLEPKIDLIVQHGEMLNPDGTLYTENLRKAKATDRHHASTPVFQPKYTFHGFRYAQISGPTSLKKDQVSALVIGTDLTRTGWFSCGNANINRLYENTVWGLRGNWVSIPTDCPQRDERLGWSGDCQVFARTACYHFDVHANLKQWLQSMVDGMSDGGMFPNVAPQLQELAEGAPGWADAGVIVPWDLLTMYGDEPTIKWMFPHMRRYVEAILDRNPDFIWRNGRSHDFGDWLNVDEDSPREPLSTMFLARDLQLMAKFAAVLNRDDAGAWIQLAQKSNEALKMAFWNGENWEGDTQTLYALSIDFGLLSGEDATRAGERLEQKISDAGGHLRTGFLGVGSLLPALTKVGKTKLAYDLLLKESYPSWLYSVLRGATTMWERWDGWTEEKGFQDPGMNSFNHYAFGSVSRWLYETVAGIRPHGIGFSEFDLRPEPDERLGQIDCKFHSRWGEIESGWKAEGGTIHYRFRVPFGTIAHLQLTGQAPKTLPAGVHEITV